MRKVKTGKKEKAGGVRQYRFDGSKSLLLVVKGETLVVNSGDEIEIDSRYMKTRKLRTLFTEVSP